MSSAAESSANTMEAVVSLAKRKGFVFQSSEIYGGYNGFFDLGPLGIELKKNIRDCWWDDMVRRRDDVVGIETSIIMHPKVWQASGHVDGFTDPLVDCKTSKQRFRADQLFFAAVVVDGTTHGYVSALESEDTVGALQAAADKVKRKPLQRDAGKLATEVAKAGREYATEARDLLAALGTDFDSAIADGATFETLMDQAKLALTTMQEQRGVAKLVLNHLVNCAFYLVYFYLFATTFCMI